MTKAKKTAAKNSMQRTQGMNNAVPVMSVITRNFQQLIPTTLVMEEAETSSESMLGVGSYFESSGLSYALRNFISSTSGVPIVYDQYRFDLIEIFVLAESFLPPYRPIMAVASVDYDDTNDPDWVSMSQRTNAKTLSLTVTNPYRKIASFKPVGNFTSVVGDAPANVVPSNNTWWDMAVTNQEFNGVKIHVASQNQGSVRVLAKAKVSFRGKI